MDNGKPTLRAELLVQARKHQQSTVRSAVEQAAAQHWHLAADHSSLQPIGHLWVFVKNKIGLENSIETTPDWMLKMATSSLVKVPNEEVRTVCVCEAGACGGAWACLPGVE
jgi:hypothetical protein